MSERSLARVSPLYGPRAAGRPAQCEPAPVPDATEGRRQAQALVRDLRRADPAGLTPHELELVAAEYGLEAVDYSRTACAAGLCGCWLDECWDNWPALVALLHTADTPGAATYLVGVLFVGASGPGGAGGWRLLAPSEFEPPVYWA